MWLIFNNSNAQCSIVDWQMLTYALDYQILDSRPKMYVQNMLPAPGFSRKKITNFYPTRIGSLDMQATSLMSSMSPPKWQVLKYCSLGGVKFFEFCDVTTYVPQRSCWKEWNSSPETVRMDRFILCGITEVLVLLVYLYFSQPRIYIWL